MGLEPRLAEERLREISAQLGVDYEPQDWGIVNADASRVDEFITFMDAESLQDTQRFQLAELILASLNERILEMGAVDEEALALLVQRHPKAFEVHLTYWCGIADDEEFPVGFALRRAGLC